MRLSTTSERVSIHAEQRSDVAVSGDARAVVEGDRTTIDRARGHVTVRVPIGTDIIIGTTSGRVEVSGPVGDVSIVTESGRIDVESADSIDARTESGRLTVAQVTGACRVQSVSGRIEIGGCAGGEAVTTSGRIEMRHVRGDVRAHCVSGRIDIELDDPHDVDAESVSGRISVRMPPGARVHRADGPTDREPAPPDCDCTVRAVTVSGRVMVAPR